MLAFYVFSLFWFQFFNGFSAQTHYEQLCIQTYNLLWTSLPVIAFGIFDQECGADSLMAHPSLYAQVSCYFFSVRA